MRVLMIFQAAPLPPPMDMGSAKRNFPFFREIIKQHEVAVVSYGSPEEEKLFRQHYGAKCIDIRFIDNRKSRAVNAFRRLWYLVSGKSEFRFVYSKEFGTAIDASIAANNVDLIHCCLAMFGYHRFPQGIPLVGDNHNVEHDLVYRRSKESRNIFLKLYYYTGYVLGKKDEIRNLSKYDVLVTTTERDKEMFQALLPGKRIEAISNGVDESFFANTGVPREPKTMIFLGLMNYYPNHHGVMYFLDEIFPKILAKEPESRLIVVGARPSAELLRRTAENITVTGFVQDVRPLVARGEVFIVPLRIGGGIRGKALEAMAMQIPIVTTKIGCEGINLVHGESAMFADTEQEFADRVVEMFRQPALRGRIADRARRIVVEEYDWKAKGRDLETIYQSLKPDPATISVPRDGVKPS